MADNNSLIIRTFLAELGTGSLDKAVSYLTEDAMWAIVQTSRGTSISKPQLKARLAGMRASLKDNVLQLKPINFIENGHSVAVEVESYAVTNLGKVYENKYCIIFKMVDGKIADIREYNDSLHVTEILLPAVAHMQAQIR
jgi:uncharacterized protein